MPIVTNPSSEKVISGAVTSSICIGFVTESPSDTEIVRKFDDPQTTFAIKPAVISPDHQSLHITCSKDSTALIEMLEIKIDCDFGRISWQPGRAIIQGKSVDTLLPAIIDFSFYEAELRRLEAAIVADQVLADSDVSLAYNIREADRSQWDRLYNTMENLYRLRLQFARLEPHLGPPPSDLPLPARRVFNRLVVKAQIEARLEAFSDRLQVLEDLYEGAVDRITDHRNYHKGSLLEIGIIVLLGLEVILLLVRHG